jgi:hypothetical protein
MASGVSVDQVISLARRYTKAELLVKIDETSALLEDARDGGVVVTAANMKESGTSGEYREEELETKLKEYRLAYNYKVRLGAGASGMVNPGVSHISFARRVWGF